MRILHTSDWHLGRSFHRESLLAHHAAFVDHLIEVVDTERVDVVLVSGDVYDRALPQVDAVALADETFARLAASRAAVVVTSGNHDSVHRLGFGSRLIDFAGVFIRTQAMGAGDPVILEDSYGPVAIYPLPYLDPDAARDRWSLAGRSHEAALTEAMRRVRLGLATQPPGARSVVMAHAFVAGAAPSDSERDISVGGISLVPTALFSGIDYVALGHLHGAQVLEERVRYSGSPLAFSFSEATHTKGSWLVDLGPEGLTGATFLEAPVPRGLSRINGTLDDLLLDPRLSGAEGDWVEATLTDDLRPPHAMERLRRRFPGALILHFEPTHRTPLSAVPGATTHGKSDFEITLDFVADLRGVAATADEASWLNAACDACGKDADADVLLEDAR